MKIMLLGKVISVIIKVYMVIIWILYAYATGYEGTQIDYQIECAFESFEEYEEKGCVSK